MYLRNEPGINETENARQMEVRSENAEKITQPQ